MALGAAHAPLRSVHPEVCHLERAVCLVLSALIRARRADQVDPVLVTGRDEVTCADISRVDQMRRWRYILGRQRGVDGGDAHRFMHVGRGGLGVDHEMGRGLITGSVTWTMEPTQCRVALVRTRASMS